MVNIIKYLFEPAEAAVELGVSIDGLTQLTSFNDYIEHLYRYSLIAGGALATLIIVYAGILYMTSQGESSRLQSAKDYFLGAIIGMAILLLMGTILNFIGAS